MADAGEKLGSEDADEAVDNSTGPELQSVLDDIEVVDKHLHDTTTVDMIPEPTKQEKTQKRKNLESWLNKLMRIKISDGRTLIGSFLCTDKDKNIILGSCQEYVGQPGVGKEDPRVLGLAMVPGRHIQSIEVDMHTTSKYGEFV